MRTWMDNVENSPAERPYTVLTDRLDHRVISKNSIFLSGPMQYLIPGPIPGYRQISNGEAEAFPARRRKPPDRFDRKSTRP